MTTYILFLKKRERKEQEIKKKKTNERMNERK